MLTEKNACMVCPPDEERISKALVRGRVKK
jgi:hypothetical protein